MKFKRTRHLIKRATDMWVYCSRGVWHDTRHTWRVNVIKTINLSVRSFFNSDMQTQACAMTYRTLLAIVPALALLFAIGRGFGLQNLLQEELMRVFPAQKEAVIMALNFVDSYLSQSSEGVFLGIGIVFLLWTLISLLSNIEDTFNLIWGVKQGRSLGRKITDYTAMLLILPVIMICASGLSLLLSTTLQAILHFSFLTPVATIIIECSSWVLTCLFFALIYFLIPNTKVKFANAMMSGVFAGTGFLILQWIFLTGQMYVARYNAIYGSVSFLPLMLIWLQLTFVVIFAGGVICYSSQNIFMYNFHDVIQNMSITYRGRLFIAVSAAVIQKFTAGNGPATVAEMVKAYNLPPNLVSMVCDKCVAAGIFSVAEIDPTHEIRGYQPALDPSTLSVKELFTRLDRQGASDFIPGFSKNFEGADEVYSKILSTEMNVASDYLLKEIKIKPLT